MLNILFLGASKRTSLLERFQKAAQKESISLKMFSCEKDDGFCAISHLAAILSGPKFADESFQDWLAGTVKKYNINIVIPNMDSATVALAKFNETRKHNCWCVVSSCDLCKKMNDKSLTEKFFGEKVIPTYQNTNAFYPKIIKDKLGFGAHGQFVVETQKEYDAIIQKIDLQNYVVQDFIKGQETTVDFYISPKEGLLGYVLRDRLEVSDGEVMNCKTRFPEADEKMLIENIARIKGWQGCITLQYIRDEQRKIRVVEINPRFGGGATCAIECGLDMPAYIINEFLGKNIIREKIKNVKMVRSRRDFFDEC